MMRAKKKRKIVSEKLMPHHTAGAGKAAIEGGLLDERFRELDAIGFRCAADGQELWLTRGRGGDRDPSTSRRQALRPAKQDAGDKRVEI
jgi:hypothetical protein